MKKTIIKIIKIIIGSPEKKFGENRFMNKNQIYDNYTIGTMSYGFPKVYDYKDNTNLRIGNYCSFADNVNILLGGEHCADFVTTYPFTTFLEGEFTINDRRSKGSVIIGNDVWVANNVTILSGITIGDGAIIGAGSIVTKDVKDYEIVAGNPAKHIRYRFSLRQIKAIKAIAWWEWDIKKIEENYKLLMSNNIDLFIQKHFYDKD